jgi:hypothetical protein
MQEVSSFCKIMLDFAHINLYTEATDSLLKEGLWADGFTVSYPKTSLNNIPHVSRPQF